MLSFLHTKTLLRNDGPLDHLIKPGIHRLFLFRLGLVSKRLPAPAEFESALPVPADSGKAPGSTSRPRHATSSNDRVATNRMLPDHSSVPASVRRYCGSPSRDSRSNCYLPAESKVFPYRDWSALDETLSSCAFQAPTHRQSSFSARPVLTKAPNATRR